MLSLSKIILFDGECHFCDKSVLFILNRDKHDIFTIASLQSHIGQQLIHSLNIDKSVSSVILIDDHKYYTESTAVLKICRHLKGFWKLFYFFIIIPKPIRNMIYRFIANHRYQWFGKKKECLLPTPEMRKKFLDFKE